MWLSLKKKDKILSSPRTQAPRYTLADMHAYTRAQAQIYTHICIDAPDKATTGHINSLLTKYHGKEAKLFRRLRKKYGDKPREPEPEDDW